MAGLRAARATARAGIAGADDHKARPVAGFVFNAACQHANAHEVGQLAVADGGGVFLASRVLGGGSGGFHRHKASVGQMGAQPRAALGQRLGM